MQVSQVAAVCASALSTVLKCSPVNLVAGSGEGFETDSQRPSEAHVRVVTTAHGGELRTAEGSSDPDTNFQSLKNLVCVGGLAQGQRDDTSLTQCFIEVQKKTGDFFVMKKKCYIKNRQRQMTKIGAEHCWFCPVIVEIP